MSTNVTSAKHSQIFSLITGKITVPNNCMNVSPNNLNIRNCTDLPFILNFFCERKTFCAGKLFHFLTSDLCFLKDLSLMRR